MMLWALLMSAVAAEEGLLSPTQQQADFDQLWAALDEMHPSLALYTPSNELDARRETVRSSFAEPLSPGVFWTRLMESVAPIGCGHTVVMPGRETFTALGEARGLFPFDLVVTEGQLQIDARTHERGGRVVSVQGIEAHELLGRLRGLTNSDGLSTPFQDFRIDGLGSYYLAFLLGTPEVYEVVVEVDGGIESRSLPGREWFERAEGSDPGPRQEADRYAADAIDPSKPGVRNAPTRKSLHGNVLLLTLDGFDEGAIRRKILRPLRTATRAKASGVVIDLRRNGGGSPWPAFELYGRFIEEEEVVYTERYWRWPHFAALRAKGDPKRLEELTRPDRVATLPIEDGLFRRDYGEVGIVQPDGLLFRGDLVVLTSGGTFSTAADFAALAKRRGRGVIVGEPTGGSATLQTSGSSVEVVLEHSRVRASIPENRTTLVDLEGRLAGSVGVAPDVLVVPSSAELGADIDRALEEAIERAAR